MKSDKVRDQDTARKEAALVSAKAELKPLIAKALKICGSREALADRCCATSASVRNWVAGIGLPNAIAVLAMQKMVEE